MIPLRWVAIDRRAYPPPRRRMERFPLERATILAMLDDETLYVPSAAAEVGYLKGSAEYIRARRAFSFFANEHGMAEAYDNTDKDDSEAAGWYGSSWKWALGGRIHRVADLMDELKKRQEARPGTKFYLEDETILTEEDLLARGQELPQLPVFPNFYQTVEETVSQGDPKGDQEEQRPKSPAWSRRRLFGLVAVSLCLFIGGWYLVLLIPDGQTDIRLAPQGRCLVSTVEFFSAGE